jgi:hypothetical protein
VNRGLPDPIDDRPPDGAEFTGVARSSRRGPIAIILAGIAVLAFAILTKPFQPTLPVPTMAASPSASLGAAETSSPRPTVAPAVRAPDLDPSATPHPMFPTTPAKPGGTRLVPFGPTPARLTIHLPAGWARVGERMVVKGGGVAPAGMSLGAWKIQNIYQFPCRWSGRSFADPGLMGTAEGQAENLASWWGQDPGGPPNSQSPLAPIATRPRLTAIDLHGASFVEVLVLRGFDFTACDGGQLVLWDTSDGYVRFGLGPGELHRLWAVDVNGGVFVIDAASFPETSEADLAELQSIIDSIDIED